MNSELTLPVAYVNLIDDCIRTILDRGLVPLLASYDTMNTDELYSYLQEIVDQFCTPILDNDKDMIIRSL
jgi:hypothetical protein